MPQIPFVLERRGEQERVLDLYSRLLEDRIVFMLGEVDDDSANLVIAQMLYLNKIDSKSDIHLYINSPGGSVTAGMAMFDVMRYISCDVATYHRPGGEHGIDSPRRGHQGQAIRPPARRGHDSPSVGRRPWPGHGH